MKWIHIWIDLKIKNEYIFNYIYIEQDTKRWFNFLEDMKYKDDKDLNNSKNEIIYNGIKKSLEDE